jgi:ribonuclease HI
LMNNNIEDLTELRLWSLERIKENKAKVARAYNKKVKLKEFQVGGVTYSFSIRLPASCTNNLAEYEAVHRGTKLFVEAGAEAVEVFGDSKLVISQLTEEYRCESESLFLLWMQCRELMTRFRYINF